MTTPSPEGGRSEVMELSQEAIAVCQSHDEKGLKQSVNKENGT
jgi:hypothetical protein